MSNSDEFDWDLNTWTVIDTFFKQDNVLIDHHLSSFNYFMNTDLQNIIREKDVNPIKIFNKESETKITDYSNNSEILNSNNSIGSSDDSQFRSKPCRFDVENFRSKVDE